MGGLRGGYEYSRSANPTRTALEESLAAIEGGSCGLAFASGLAAEDTLLRVVCRPGDHVILPGDAYGGTFRLVARVLANLGLEHTPVPRADLDAVRAAIRPDTKVVWCQTPTNPLLGIADISALASIAHEVGALLVVDSTFASPYLQRPLALGADVVCPRRRGFTPDGALVALGGDDGQAHLLTADRLTEIGQLPIGTGATWALAAYSTDGSTLSAVDERGHIMHWDTRPQSWIHHVCAIAARDLTPTEWDTYPPGVPRQRTCTTG